MLTVRQTVRALDVEGVMYDGEEVEYYIDDHVGVWDLSGGELDSPVSLADYMNPAAERVRRCPASPAHSSLRQALPHARGGGSEEARA